MSDPDLYGPDDRRKHLDMVQAVVSRMASSSSTSKGWLLPVVTATYGFALVQHVPLVAALGLAAIAVFGGLDGHYLRQERAFRVLFRDIARGNIGGYDMNPNRYFHKPNGDEDDERDENCRWWHVICSWSLLGFYGPPNGRCAMPALAYWGALPGSFDLHVWIASCETNHGG